MGTSSMWRRLRTGRALWLVLPAALLVFMGASSPEISQRVPRFVFPFLAVVGAALLVFSFVNSLVRFVRFYRRDGRSNVLPLVVNAIATLPRIAGCFDSTKLYPVDRLVLTSPVKC